MAPPPVNEFSSWNYVGMSSNANSAPTGNTGATFASKLKSVGGGGTIGIWAFGITAVGLFIGAFVSMTKFVGSKDDWNVIQPQITKILILTLVGTITLMIAALLYFMQDPARTIYFILVLSCLTLGMSFSALAISAISR
jgi:hypothetical protein